MKVRKIAALYGKRRRRKDGRRRKGQQAQCVRDVIDELRRLLADQPWFWANVGIR